MHRMTYSSVHLCNPPKAISDVRLNPSTDASLLPPPTDEGFISHLVSFSVIEKQLSLFFYRQVRYDTVIENIFSNSRRNYDT